MEDAGSSTPPAPPHVSAATDPLHSTEIRDLIGHTASALAPFESFIADPSRDVMMIPAHLLALQELIDGWALCVHLLPSPQYNPLMRKMLFAREELDTLERTMPETRQQALWERTARGQLRLNVNTDTLCELVELQFTDATISIMLGVSAITVRRRRRKLGLVRRGDTMVSDEDLIAAIESTYKMGMSVGERGMRGALRAVGVSVSRARLRLALQANNPHRVQALWAKTTKRRDYYVPFVNSLWHIDGHHKLIKYKIVIHGGVDGKSRVVTFMRANSNNRADTVADCFLEATERCGWPSRVRADHGGENLEVMRLMEEARGHNRGSFIQGPSTRNQRIERMWVDVQRWTTAQYKALFQAMEESELLDVNCSIHLWCLHLVFLPQLNKALDHFQDVWNMHPVRTAGSNWSPQQMHTAGVLEAERKGFDLRTRPAVLEEEEAAEDIRQHALRNFAEYGDDVAREGRERRENDPHVVLDPVERDLPALLLDPAVRGWVEAEVPLQWPPGEDMGLGRYTKVLEVVSELLEAAEGQEGEGSVEHSHA
ncbi:hypothetical protein CF328_g7583 [Tilletia controversa]|nr:hypothetical protein CF328_g7583 [Tilletia controversa]